MQHERLGGLAGHVDAVDPLLVVGGAERDGDQRLGLAALNSAEPWVRGSTPVSIDDRADGVEIAAVDPLALLEHLLAHDPVLDVLEHVADLAAPVGEALEHLGDGLLAHGADAGWPGRPCPWR